jgi:hypothetical protein
MFLCCVCTKVGTLRYFGEIELTSGQFCGVELDEPAGLNDGSVQGVRYFTCRPQHGIIAPAAIVRPLLGGSWQQPPDICSRRNSSTIILDESGPYSLLEGLSLPDEGSVEQMERDANVEDCYRDPFLNHTQTQVGKAARGTRCRVTANPT